MIDTSIILALLGIILGLLGLSWFAGTDAPYVPTKLNFIPEVLKKAGVAPGKIFYELGSGDGRVVIAAAKLGAEAHGVEQSWLRVWYSRFTARQLGLKNAHFYHGNIFKRHYFPADVVYIYMLQKAVDRLENQLKKELKKNAMVITQRYHFKNWPEVNTDGEFKIYQAPGE